MDNKQQTSWWEINQIWRLALVTHHPSLLLLPTTVTVTGYVYTFTVYACVYMNKHTKVYTRESRSLSAYAYAHTNVYTCVCVLVVYPGFIDTSLHCTWSPSKIGSLENWQLTVRSDVSGVKLPEVYRPAKATGCLNQNGGPSLETQRSFQVRAFFVAV